MTAPRILSPEEFRALKDGPKPKVTVGPLQPVGIPADEMARIASGEMGLGNSIAARLQLAHEPDANANAVLEDVNRRTAPGLAATTANVFLSNAVAPFSEKMAEAGTEGALERFATGRGDPGAHANLLGIAAAGGAVTGNAALAKATPPINIRGASALKAVGLRAAEGAAQNAGVSLAGSVMDEDSLPGAAKKALLNAGAGAVFGGAVEGAGRFGELRADLTPEPKPPVAEQVRSEILGKLDPRDRNFAMNDTQFGRAFNPEGRPYVMSPEEFAQAKAARASEQSADVARLRDGVATAEQQPPTRDVRFPVERTAAARNAEPVLNLKNRAGKVDLRAPETVPDRFVGVADGERMARVPMTRETADAESALSAFQQAMEAKYRPALGAAFYRDATKALAPEELARLDALQSAYDAAIARNRGIGSRLKNRPGELAPEVGQALASAGVGAAVGASQNEDDRMQGALLGGAAGLAAYAGAKRGAKLGLGTEDVSGNPRFPRAEPEGTPYRAPIDDGEDPRLFNLKKHGFSAEGEQIFRDIVGQLDLRKKRVSHAATMTEAERRATDPDALIRLKGQWDGADALGARLFTAASTERIALLSRNIRKGGMTPEEAEGARAEISRLTDDIGIMAGRSAKERSAAGRNLNAYKIVARNTMDVPTWQELAQRAKGLPLTTGELLTLRQHVTDLNREGLVQFVAGLHKSTTAEKAMALWKAGLLAAPVPHIVNNASNATMLAMETAKEPIAAMADRVISLVRNSERTKALSLRGLATDPLMAGGRSLRAAADAIRGKGALGALRDNMTQDMIGKWDFRQTNFESPILQAYTDVVFGSLSAEDRLWRNMAFARSMEEQVRLAAPKVAKAEGITIAQAQAKLRQSPPDELTLKAVGDAEVAVFQNKNALAAGMTALKRAVREHAGPAGEAVVDFVAPFVRTPTNVALRLVDYSPLGAVKLWKVLKPELSSAEQKQAAEQVGRVALGSGLVWLGFSLAADGKATGAAPRDATARATYELQGKQANSVRIGDSWVNVSRLSPAGMLVALGAQMHDIAASAESPSGAVAGSLYAPARVALDQSFLKGVSGTLDALNDPSRYGERFAENTVGSLIPSGVAAVARATDKTVRKPEGFGQTLAARVPGLSQLVPARRDAFGQAIQRTASAPEGLLSPAPRTASRESDPVVKELARLEVPVAMPARSLSLGKGKGKQKLTQDEYDAMLREVGFAFRQRLQAEMGSPEYAAMPDEEKADVLSRVLSRARTQMYARQRERLTGTRMVGNESPP